VLLRRIGGTVSRGTAEVIETLRQHRDPASGDDVRVDAGAGIALGHSEIENLPAAAVGTASGTS
jgi:hypothetical protein